MKKTLAIILLLFLTILNSVMANVSFFGLNGLNFIPSGRTGEKGENGMALSSLPAPISTLNITPFSFHLFYTIMEGIEIGLTNTYQYYFEETQDYFDIFTMPGGGFIAETSNLVFPIIPSVKFGFLDNSVPNGSIAFGIEYPFGIFASFDYILTIFKDFSCLFIVGLSTTFEILYGFAGVKFSFPIPFSLILEGAYGGKTEYLTIPQEAFISGGINYAINDYNELDFIFRWDRDNIRRFSLSYSLKF